MSHSGYGNHTPPVGGDHNHGIALRDVTIVTFTIALLMLVLRLQARVFIVKKTGWDDWVMVLATVSETVDPRQACRDQQLTYPLRSVCRLLQRCRRLSSSSASPTEEEGTNFISPGSNSWARSSGIRSVRCH